MYNFPKKTKILCFGLMCIGLISLIYGFIQSNQNQYTDLEIRKEVKQIYFDYQTKDKSHSGESFNTEKSSSKKSIKKNQKLKIIKIWKRKRILYLINKLIE